MLYLCKFLAAIKLTPFFVSLQEDLMDVFRKLKPEFLIIMMVMRIRRKFVCIKMMKNQLSI
jgi:hypothetical protein